MKGIIAVTGGLLAMSAWAGGNGLRVLVTHGGHGFNQKAFFGLFERIEGVAFTAARLPEEAALLRPGLEASYDAIVMYDMVRGITPEQQESFKALLARGIGVVSLHHNLGAHRNWGEFAGIIGGKYLFKVEKRDGRALPQSGYAHGQDMRINVADTNHPITRDIDNFEIHDETYSDFYLAPSSHVLLTTDHPKADRAVAWTTSYGASRVFYLQLGHDEKAWRHRNYARLIERGIRWVAKQSTGD